MAIAEELAALRERTLAEIAAADTSAALEAVRVAVLGKSGTLTGYLRSMGQVPAEERASVGKVRTRPAWKWKRRWPPARRHSMPPSWLP